jgi:hypothetical protein
MTQFPQYENTNEVSFNLFPNPGKDELYINFEDSNDW